MITVVGDLMVDVLFVSELRREEQSTGLLLRPGGSAANTAAWIAELGHPVTFVGKVGNDVMGDTLEKELKERGVTTRISHVIGGETGAVAVEVSLEGERVMRSSRGANEDLLPSDIRDFVGDPTMWIHLTGYALLSPHRFRLLRAAGRMAGARGATLSFDPSSVGVIERVGARRLLKVAAESGVNLLLPNRLEAEALAGGDTIEDAARRLAERFPRIVVKAGPAGAVWAEGQDFGVVGTEPRVPRDTTGAGDAFDAGVLVGLARGETLVGASRLGNEIAGRVIMAYGGRPPRPQYPRARLS